MGGAFIGTTLATEAFIDSIDDHIMHAKFSVPSTVPVFLFSIFFYREDIMSLEDRVEKLESDLKKLEQLEHNTNFRLLLVALAALVATLIAVSGFFV